MKIFIFPLKVLSFLSAFLIQNIVDTILLKYFFQERTRYLHYARYDYKVATLVHYIVKRVWL